MDEMSFAMAIVMEKWHEITTLIFGVGVNMGHI